MENLDIRKLIEIEGLAISTGNLSEQELIELIDVNRKIKEIYELDKSCLEESVELGMLLKRSGDLVLKSHSATSGRKRKMLTNKAYGVVALVFLVFVLAFYFMDMANA